MQEESGAKSRCAAGAAVIATREFTGTLQVSRVQDHTNANLKNSLKFLLLTPL